MTPFARVLAGIVPRERVREAVALAPFTTFRIGGSADCLVEVQSETEMRGVIDAARGASVPVTLLGGGSNVLISDAGVRGVVVRLRLKAISQSAPDRVRAEAGVTMNGLVRWTIGRGLAGVEAWAGTPGTVGGAIFGNAHFGGRNIGEYVSRVRLLTRDGDAADAAAGEMEFAYDSSRLQRTREIVIWAEFAVAPGDVDMLRAEARRSLAHRKRTQPLDVPSAGCIFQNPDPDTMPAGLPASAGALVDRAGLKGCRVGGASVSTEHANFFLNDGHATARDVRALIEQAKARVRDQFGVALREEVVYLGDF